ncbi:MAG TPA: hypothetical protein PLW68_13770 [Casimicrobiaceae bacterium]|nr:hypothetical protein [Casimicrobiaceae bacterium]
MEQSIHHHRTRVCQPEARAIGVPPLARLAAALKRHVPLAGALILAAAWAAPSQASQLIPQNLKQMIQVAEVIVTGEVVRISDGIEGGLPFTEVTLKVNGSIKRDIAANSDYTFRQYGLLKPRKLQDGRYLLPSKIEGMATWTVGEKVTTFMNKPAGRTRMTTPVGMAQGKFTYSGTHAANSFDNRGLFKGMSVQPDKLNAREAAMLAKPSGPVDGDVLMSFVKRAVKEQWIEKGVMR